MYRNKAGIEGAVHSMCEFYVENAGTGWELILVDAKNVYNSVTEQQFYGLQSAIAEKIKVFI